MTRRQQLRCALILVPGILGIAVSVGPWLHSYYRERPYRRVSLQDLGNFQFNELHGTENDIPEQFRKLDGTRVAVQGMMWDLRSAGPNVSQFQLVYNILHHKFGPPLVQERIFVYATAGQPIQWFDQVVVVRGTLHVHIRRDDTGVAREVYTLTEAQIGLVPPPPPPEISEAWISGLVCTVALALLGARRRLLGILSGYSDRRRLRSGWFCRRCGYDLRASIVRCPECGTPFTAPWRFDVIGDPHSSDGSEVPIVLGRERR
jgi:hypothetical protein